MKKVYMICASNSWVGKFATDDDGCGEDTFIKIGVSGDPEKRLANLSTGCPMNLNVRCGVEFEDDDAAYRVENLLHQILDEGRCEGEWFLSAEAAKNFEGMRAYVDKLLIIESMIATDMLVEYLSKHHNFFLKRSEAPVVLKTQTRTFTAEHRAKLSAAGKGRVMSAEWRAKIGAASRGQSWRTRTRAPTAIIRKQTKKERLEEMHKKQQYRRDKAAVKKAEKEMAKKKAEAEAERGEKHVL